MAKALHTKRPRAARGARPRRSARGARPRGSVLRLFGARRGLFLAALIPLAASSALVLAVGVILRRAVDLGFAAGSQTALDTWALALLAVILGLSAAAWLRFYLTAHAAELAARDLRLSLLRGLLGADESTLAAHGGSGLPAGILADTSLIQVGLATVVPMAVRHILLFCGGLGLVFWTSPRLAFLLLLILPPLVLLIFQLGGRVRRLSRRHQEELARVGDTGAEACAGISTIRSLGRESFFGDLLRRRLDESLGSARSRVRARAHLTAAALAVCLGGVVLVLWLGGRGVIAGDMSAGTLSAFVFYAVVVAGAAAALGEVSAELGRMFGAHERLDEIAAWCAPAHPNKESAPTPANAPEEKGEDAPAPTPARARWHKRKNARAPAPPNAASPTPSPSPSAPASLELRSLSYRYPGASSDALCNVSAKIEAGGFTALVGPAGAGKSTLFRLLQGRALAASGTILWDGKPLGGHELADLRSRIGLVEQEPFLFSLSLRENLLLGLAAGEEREVSDSELSALLARLGAGALLARLPQGLDTLIGPRGRALSGGERQVVAIARALIREPSVLLLDEASAALDAEGEEALRTLLESERGRRTIVVIAHRLSTVRAADEILVLQEGHLIERGTHEGLLSHADGLYRRFAALQLQGGEPAGTRATDDNTDTTNDTETTESTESTPAPLA